MTIKQFDKIVEVVRNGGVDVWKVAEGEPNYGVADETIERIIEHFSDDKRQLVGVLWYNK